MFGRDEKKDDLDIMGFIGKGMKVEGKLSFEKTIRIDGSFKGEITAPGALVVGESGFVKGHIKVGTVLITGEVVGTVEARERVELHSPGRINGDIKTPTLIIGEGTAFDGNCIMLKGEAAGEKAQNVVVKDTFRELIKKSG